MYIDYFLETSPGRDNNARIRSLRTSTEIDELTRVCSQNNLEKFAKKHFSNEMKILLHTHLPQMISKCISSHLIIRTANELNNSESVMIFVVRLASSPIWEPRTCKQCAFSVYNPVGIPAKYGGCNQAIYVRTYQAWFPVWLSHGRNLARP
jgi:hypothetical protein